mmetsp:Transcript_48414/g.144598  ORF Transcript_48414/g.144598 Transcript_48414/m.144598 type:complete len:209 (+) Transcript_48414:940-1566(+)
MIITSSNSVLMAVESNACARRSANGRAESMSMMLKVLEKNIHRLGHTMNRETISRQKMASMDISKIAERWPSSNSRWSPCARLTATDSRIKMGKTLLKRLAAMPDSGLSKKFHTIRPNSLRFLLRLRSQAPTESRIRRGSSVANSASSDTIHPEFSTSLMDKLRCLHLRPRSAAAHSSGAWPDVQGEKVMLVFPPLLGGPKMNSMRAA